MAAYVVMIHVEFLYYPELNPLLRCAVPCFFMISGYFIYTPYKDQMNARAKKALKHILIILAYSTLCYFLYRAVQLYQTGGGQLLSLGQIKDCILFNRALYGFHLWYVYAYVYVLIIVYLANRFNLLAWLKWSTPILLLGFITLGKYSELIFGEDFKVVLTRNFLFDGLPFFTLGMILKEHWASITRSRWAKVAGWLAIIFSVTSIIERYILVHYDLNSNGSIFISSIFLSVCLFTFFARWGEQSEMHAWSWLASIGREDSLYIYIFHVIVRDYTHKLFNRLGLEDVYQAIGFVIVFILTLALVRGARFSWRACKKRRRR